MTDSGEHALPPRPEPPAPGECCGSGCDPCIYDLYERALERWERRVRRLRERHVKRDAE